MATPYERWKASQGDSQSEDGSVTPYDRYKSGIKLPLTNTTESQDQPQPEEQKPSLLKRIARFMTSKTGANYVSDQATFAVKHPQEAIATLTTQRPLAEDISTILSQKKVNASNEALSQANKLAVDRLIKQRATATKEQKAKIDNTIKLIQSNSRSAITENVNNPTLNKTPTQIVGDVTQSVLGALPFAEGLYGAGKVASTELAPGILGKVNELLKFGDVKGAETLLQKAGIIAGNVIKAGAKSVPIGTAFGGASVLSSGEKNPKQIAKDIGLGVAQIAAMSGAGRLVGDIIPKKGTAIIPGETKQGLEALPKPGEVPKETVIAEAPKRTIAGDITAPTEVKPKMTPGMDIMPGEKIIKPVEVKAEPAKPEFDIKKLAEDSARKNRITRIKEELKNTRDALKSHPIRPLTKYLSNTTGEFPEVTGKKGASIFGKSGDDIASYSGFNDTSELDAALKDYNSLKKAEKNLQDMLGKEMSVKTTPEAPKIVVQKTQPTTEPKSLPSKTSVETIKPKEEGIAPAEVVKTSEPSITAKPSKVARSIDAKAIEVGLTDGFKDIAGYEPITIKDQAVRAANVMTDMEKATRMVLGKEPLAPGLKAEMLVKAMEDHAVATGNSEMLRKLSASPLVSETSGHAQALRLLAERDPSSPLTVMRDLTNTRIKVAEARLKGKTIQQVAKTDFIEATKVDRVAAKIHWQNFVQEIRCK